MRRLEAVAAIEVRLREINQGFVRDAAALIRPYMEKGEIAPLRFEILLALLFGPAQEFLRLWFSGRTDLGLRQALWHPEIVNSIGARLLAARKAHG
jgi:hypothetical protein